MGKLSGPPPEPFDLPEKFPPHDLNWDKWVGPLQYIHYHPDLNPPISLDPPRNETFWAKWRFFKETGGGLMTDWGAHNFDIAQWALGRDDSGPVRVIPAGHEGRDHITFIYDDGVEVINAPFTSEGRNGIKIQGEDAWFVVKRGHVEASDESLLPQMRELEEAASAETGSPHHVNFIRAVRLRRNPIATAEIGHRSNTVGVLGNIASFLDRPLQWDPVRERFVNDSEADDHLHREYRSGYRLV
jgi:predicted dehydrogenase